MDDEGLVARVWKCNYEKQPKKCPSIEDITKAIQEITKQEDALNPYIDAEVFILESLGMEKREEYGIDYEEGAYFIAVVKRGWGTDYILDDICEFIVDLSSDGEEWELGTSYDSCIENSPDF